MPKRLSPDLIERYQELGYCTAVPALTAEEVARHRASLECFEAQSGPIRGTTLQFKPHLHQHWAHEIATNASILDALEDVIGPDILLIHFTLWIKEPRTDAFVAWHQDGTYFGLSPAEHITAWVALSDSSDLSGCMEVVPGSHKLGQMRHCVADDADNMLRTGQRIDVPDDAPRALLPVPPGHFSLHHTNLLHNSRANRADDRRIGLGISYIPTHVKCSSKTRLTAMLVRGVDAFNHFDHEHPPGDDARVNRARHAEAMKLWNASRKEQTERVATEFGAA